MRSGALRHTAKVYVKSSTPDAYGDFDSSETLLGTYKCSMKQKYWQERAENGEMLSRMRYDLMFRFREELAVLPPDAEIVLDDTYRLVVMTASDPDGKRRRVWVTAEIRL